MTRAFGRKWKVSVGAQVTDQQEATWTARVLTLFPDMFPGPLRFSLAGKALQAGVWALEPVDVRDFACDRHGTVDDAPFGGGPGMVMRADVLDAAIVGTALPAAPLIFLTPRGTPLTQARVRALAEGPGVTLLCGRYEGIDQRVLDARNIEEISLGDFILSGGEPAAIALIDACVRLLPGVIGDEAALDEESFTGDLLEYPHYTRPAVWSGRRVPEVLLSGHHQRIVEWRRQQAEQITLQRRPDLWDRYEQSCEQEREACHEPD